ncbi:MAG: hypothetical protein Q9M15_02565 [Mariprofundaceae bacterium]|nr:hypothetical protein [Mariprofundaceae bacterium]
MTEILLISLIILAIVHIVVVFKKEVKVDIKPQLNDFEDRIKSEIQRNRTESNDISEKNRKELSGSIGNFEKKLTDSNDKTNAFLNDKFNQQNDQQCLFNKQISDAIKENRSELTKSLSSFEDKFSQNIGTLNDLLTKRFKDFGQQQTQSNKQSTENIKSIETTIDSKFNKQNDQQHVFNKQVSAIPSPRFSAFSAKQASNHNIIEYCGILKITSPKPRCYF